MDLNHYHFTLNYCNREYHLVRQERLFTLICPILPCDQQCYFRETDSSDEVQLNVRRWAKSLPEPRDAATLFNCVNWARCTFPLMMLHFPELLQVKWIGLCAGEHGMVHIQPSLYSNLN